MKGQKQSRVDNLEKRMAAVTNVLQQLINEIENTKIMALGVHQTIKEMPDYDEAIEKLKKQVLNRDFHLLYYCKTDNDVLSFEKFYFQEITSMRQNI